MQNFPPPNVPPMGSPQMPQPPAAPPGKSKLPWIIAGGVGCLLLIVIALVALGGMAYFIGQNAPRTTPTPAAEGRGPAPAPADGTKRYVNTRVGRTGNLAENYVDFYFDYPQDWTLDPDPSPSYVRVEDNEGELTRENFSVGWFSATVAPAGNREFLSRSVNQFSGQISGNFPGYEKVSEGPTEIGGNEGYELRFQRSGEIAEGQLAYWGRIVLLMPDESAKKGVALIMVATSKAEGVEDVEDVGVEAGLPVILNSFRFGTAGEAGQ
ncbi:MAG: hypothetical protein ACRD9R_15405 [Pyrinomonadaceae bacterium]